MTQLLPEVFTLIGINLFLVLSLVIFLLDNSFPKVMSYVYQVVALLDSRTASKLSSNLLDVTFDLLGRS